MISVKIDVRGLADVQRKIDQIGKQATYATAVALTRTAQQAQQATVAEMRARFDRPTPTVLRSLFVKPAKKSDLTSMIYVKDKPFGGKNPRSMAEIIGHQFSGGARIAKSLEEALRRAGYLQAGEFIIPGAAAKLDRYGNWSRGQIVQVLSQLAVGAAGYANASTTSKRSRRSVAMAGAMFWSAGAGGAAGKALVDAATGITYGFTGRGGRASHLPKGVWMRSGRNVKPIAIVVSGAPTYRRLIDMPRIVRETVARHFAAEFDRALQQALATAK